eukprot:2267671-Alexandrium_andersonii.AAC.1
MQPTASKGSPNRNRVVNSHSVSVSVRWSALGAVVRHIRPPHIIRGMLCAVCCVPCRAVLC